MKEYICILCKERKKSFVGNRRMVREHIKEYHRFKSKIGKFVEAREI